MGERGFRQDDRFRKGPSASFLFILFTCACACAFACLLIACAPKARPYYNRQAGGYVTPDPSQTPTAAVPEALAHAPYGDTAAGDSGAAPGAEPGMARLRKAAEAYLGVPYRFGGQSRWGMDCSGFIGTVFEEVYGIKLPRSSRGMFRIGEPVARADLRPGDLVFFKNMGYIDHSGIYMGENYFIHSATSVGVSYSTLDAPYFGTHYAGARRLNLPP